MGQEEPFKLDITTVKRPEREGYRVTDFELAMQRLLATHEIEMEEFRNEQRKPATRLAPVHERVIPAAALSAGRT